MEATFKEHMANHVQHQKSREEKACHVASIWTPPEIFGPLSSMCLRAGGEILSAMHLLMKEVTPVGVAFRKFAVALLSPV